MLYKGLRQYDKEFPDSRILQYSMKKEYSEKQQKEIISLHNYFSEEQLSFIFALDYEIKNNLKDIPIILALLCYKNIFHKKGETNKYKLVFEIGYCGNEEEVELVRKNISSKYESSIIHQSLIEDGVLTANITFRELFPEYTGVYIGNYEGAHLGQNYMTAEQKMQQLYEGLFKRTVLNDFKERNLKVSSDVLFDYVELVFPYILSCVYCEPYLYVRNIVDLDMNILGVLQDAYGDGFDEMVLANGYSFGFQDYYRSLKNMEHNRLVREISRSIREDIANGVVEDPMKAYKNN